MALGFTARVGIGVRPPPASDKVKNEWRYTSAPPTRLHGAYTISPFYCNW